MKNVISVILGLVLLSGCASPCMKKSTLLQQKQCKWERRQNRDIAMFSIAGVGSLVLLPFVAGHIFGKGDAPKWLGPTFMGVWSMGMFGAMDGSTWIGDYPHAKDEKEGR